jgi:type I restriction-modification system DNA methylase subunit
MPTYYHNETLFSEIYLEEITHQTENADVLASLKVLGEYREFADTHSLRAWKESYVHEVLSALGFFAKSKTEALTQLFPMGNAGTENPLSLCYVVLPDENLDNTTIGRNWAEKIIRALRENNLQWGLLTNGKQWRIYHQNESTPYETYLEIDLEAILKEKAKEAYQIFHKFMKAENFAIQEDSKCQFDRFKKESQDKIDYIEKELANALRQREEGGKGVLSDICMGYVEELRHRNEGNLDDEDLRKKIYHGAMLYMFRLLFLFYADARRLLSEENHVLLEKVEVECRAHHDGGSFGESSLPIWDNLEQIFVDIDQTYNGGLFSPQESEFTRFLSDTRIGDNYITNVIFNLTTYREKNGQEKPISYRDMSVRHLGTLYEGLLEHKLYIAKEDTEVKVAKGKIQFIPVSLGGKLIVGHYIRSGEVYFAGDPSERKSSGSYFTPEDVVDYIVRNTVGEKLKELKGAFLDEQRQTLEACHRAVNEDERAELGVLLEGNAKVFIHERVLTLSVLDPAMGSGHFLVNTTNLISNFVSEILNELDVEGSLDSNTGYWRRWVVENCIYGVDLNQLAVELAKLSLWILSMAKDQPLSFLKHHLKCGNSLVGARLDEIGSYPCSMIKKETHQLSLFERDPDFRSAVEEAISKSQLIAARGSTARYEVEEKKAWLDEIDQALSGYKAICNVHTGLFFNSNGMDENQYSSLVNEKNFNLAYQLEGNNQYIHWELEFPMVLLNQKGFDCIIGNPPYVENSTLEYPIVNYQMKQCGNLFALFLELATKLSTCNSSFSMVVPISIVSTERMSDLQSLLLSESSQSTFSNFAVRPATLFDNVDMNITIVTCKKDESDKKRILSTSYTRWFPHERPELFNRLSYVDCTNFVVPGRIPKLGDKIEVEILKKMKSKMTTVRNFVDEKYGKTVYYHSGGRYWRKAILERLSTEYKPINIMQKFHPVILGLLNTNLFYWYWIIFSDCYHVVKGDVLNFPINCFEFSSDSISRIDELTKKLMDEYETNAIYVGGRGGNQQKQFFPAKSKHTIDMIDSFFSEHYGFTSQETAFILDFDRRFRGLDND